MIESVEAPGVRTHFTLAWILVPAVIMSLGWGLRGYIGGGPFGAMIPGALVSLMLCEYLMGLGMSDIWWPNPEVIAPAGGRWSFLWQ